MAHNEAIIFEKKYNVLTPNLDSMREDMVSRVVTEAAMESTSVYWMPVWDASCDSMSLKLVNPYFIRQLPGRKSDVKDAQWIAECLQKNLIRGSFVPDPVIQDMRKYNRRIFDLKSDRVYYLNKLDAALQRCGFRLSNYVSSIDGKSFQKVVKAIAAGETDPKKLVRLVHGRPVNSKGEETIKAALTGRFHKADIDVIKQYLEEI